VLLFLHTFFEIFDGLAHSRNLLGVLIRNFAAKFLLEGHNQFDEVQRVGLQVLAEARLGGDFAGVSAEQFDAWVRPEQMIGPGP